VTDTNEGPGEDATGEQSASPPGSSRVLTVSRRVIPWIGTVLIFAYIFYRVPIRDVLDSFHLVRPVIFISLYTIQFVIFFNMDALAHYLVFNWFNAKTGWVEVFFARGATYILSLLNYFVGQGGIGFWLARKKNVSATEATSSIVFLLFMDLFSLILFASIGVMFLLEDVKLTDFFSLKSEGHLVRFTLITLVVMLFQVSIWLSRTEAPLARWLLFRGPFLVFGRALGSQFAILLLVKVGIFLSDVLFTWLLLKSFGIDIPLMLVFTYLPLIYLIGSIPITVFHLGTTQAAYIWFFKDFAEPEVLIAFSLLINFMMPLTRTVAGSLCLRRISRELFAKIESG